MLQVDGSRLKGDDDDDGGGCRESPQGQAKGSRKLINAPSVPAPTDDPGQGC